MSEEQNEGEIMEVMPKENVDAVKNKKATYEIQDQISKGSRGCIFQVLRLEDKKPLAMKCEALKVKNALLKHEAKVYEALKSFYSPHFLSFEDRGVVEERFTFIVLKLIGKNLADVQWKCPDRKFSLITALHIGEQTLAAIRDLHFCGYIHRDIKPHNFAIGREEDKNYHTVYIIDFKFARRFKTETKDLRLERAQAAFRGTPRYASITALSMKEQSRKDDLESWWYMMVEFMVGRLPWADLADQKPYKLDDIKHVKKQIRLKNNLTKLLKATPEEYMTNIILYIDTLQYNSIPDYDYVAANLATSVKAYYLHKDAPPDWDLMAEYKGPRYEKTV